MTRGVTLAGFAVVAGAILVFQAYGLATRRTLTLGDVVGLLARRPAVRILLMAAWLWLGWHIFVRVDL